MSILLKILLHVSLAFMLVLQSLAVNELENKHRFILLSTQCSCHELTTVLSDMNTAWDLDEIILDLDGMAIVSINLSNDADIDLFRHMDCVQIIEPNFLVKIENLSSAPFGLDRIDQRMLPLDGTKKA